MEQLIPIASKLQDVLGALGQEGHLDLPQIVVIGGQSSGKSSVLESLVGRSFLPRGTGIVTRRPLILQLYNTSNGAADKDTSSSNEWGEFLHLPQRKFTDFGLIRQEILAETERLTGQNKGIHDAPIHLKIFSPRVLALTLVDLPGMCKNPVGDQPVDIERQIQDMCVKYIANPNAIVLAVTSANTDLANSDALRLARQVDPAGHRTLGVLTKLDLMDPGTDCADVLRNQVVPLRRGYIAVVNRGQQDVVSDTSIQQGLQKEQAFFKRHGVYKSRDLQSKCGTSRLAKNLNSLLMHHIRDCLPDLKTRIAHMMSDVQQELDALGHASQSKSGRGAALLNLLSKFATNFGKVLDGSGGPDLEKRMSKLNLSESTSSRQATSSFPGAEELCGGARISYVFTQVFANSLYSVGAFDGLTDGEIRTTIANANGTRPALFVPEISFDILVKRQIARLEPPGVQCVDLVYEELQRIASQSEPAELTRFPHLRNRIVEVVSFLLKRCVGPTQMMVANLIKMELAYINTSHPDFIGGSRAVARLMDTIGKENDKDRQAVWDASMRTDGEAPATKTADATTKTAVGATPLSSSSLNDYYGNDNDEAYENQDPSTPYADKNNTSGGGLMGYIFRGGGTGGAMDGPTTANATTATTTPTRSSVAGMMTPPMRRISTKGPSSVHLPQVPDRMKQTDVPPTERERVEMEVIKTLVESYFGIVRKTFIDLVPKTIMLFLVNHVRDSLQNELVSELYRDHSSETIGTLMKEADDIAARRQTCMEMKTLLGKALEIVNEVREFKTEK